MEHNVIYKHENKAGVFTAYTAQQKQEHNRLDERKRMFPVTMLEEKSCKKEET